MIRNSLIVREFGGMAFRRRRSNGSIPVSSAIRSRATSIEYRMLVPPCARIAPDGGFVVYTRRPRYRKFGTRYGPMARTPL